MFLIPCVEPCFGVWWADSTGAVYQLINIDGTFTYNGAISVGTTSITIGGDYHFSVSVDTTSKHLSSGPSSPNRALTHCTASKSFCPPYLRERRSTLGAKHVEHQREWLDLRNGLHKQFALEHVRREHSRQR